MSVPYRMWVGCWLNTHCWMLIAQSVILGVTVCEVEESLLRDHGQCLVMYNLQPTNLIYPRCLSGCLDSLPVIPTSTITPLSIIEQWNMPSYIANGSDHVVGSRVCRGGNGVSPVLVTMIHLLTIIPWIFSDGVIHLGRVGCILTWTIEAGLVMWSSRCLCVRTQGQVLCCIVPAICRATYKHSKVRL